MPKQIALLVQRCVVVAEDRAVRPRWNHRRHGSGLLNPVDQLIRIIPLVGQHGVSVKAFQQRLGLCTVMPFTPGYNEAERITQRIAHA